MIGLCTWCHHPDHPPGCTKKIQTGPDSKPNLQLCPCKKGLAP